MIDVDDPVYRELMMVLTLLTTRSPMDSDDYRYLRYAQQLAETLACGNDGDDGQRAVTRAMNIEYIDTMRTAYAAMRKIDVANMELAAGREMLKVLFEGDDLDECC